MQKYLTPLGFLLLWASTAAIAQNKRIPRHKVLIENATNYLVTVDLILDRRVVFLKLAPHQKRYHILHKLDTKEIGNWRARVRTKNYQEYRVLKGKNHYVVYFDKKREKWKIYRKR